MAAGLCSLRILVLASLVAGSGALACVEGVASLAEAPAEDSTARTAPIEPGGLPTAPSGGKDGGVAGEGRVPGPGVDDGILGTLSGDCGVVKALLGTAAPSKVDNTLVFVAGETYERASLSPGGQILFDEPNAGGSSVESEIMSFEVLRHCEGATLVKTETQIAYAPPGPGGTNAITDILVSIDGQKVGVSVTRAYKPPSMGLTDDDVRALLEKKLEGINQSSARVLPEDRWVKQILHVFAVDEEAAAAVGRALPAIDVATRADTVVLVTRTEGGGFVYCNPDPPLGSECP
jgi:hypothetical protein